MESSDRKPEDERESIDVDAAVEHDMRIIEEMLASKDVIEPNADVEHDLRLLEEALTNHDPCDAKADCFRPPKTNCVVGCLHCGEMYDSYRIEWREHVDGDGTKRGFWCCPIEGCDGKGFLFDIHPVDPNWEDDEDRGMTGGWFDDDGNPCSPFDLE